LPAVIRAVVLSLILAGAARAGIDLRLPTENHHLFTGTPEKFYMYVDRTFEGVTSQPWEAGSFGLVRNALRINDQVILTKFHEGIDISPVNRDKAGNPLDLASSIGDGQVVYTCPVSGRSNYGKYVVVEHPWDGSSIYSLYAHLAEVTCAPGDPVKAGSVLGRMGYTGAGINRTRAHLHLEIGMMLTRNYDSWNRHAKAGTNHHGLFNGMNLIGADVAGFFLKHKENPDLTFSQYVTGTPVYFKVTVPSKGMPDFVSRHPWILKGDPQGARSWEISMTALGMPVAFTPSQRQVETPVVTAIRPSLIPQRYLTRNLVSGEGNHATLTTGGRQLITLLTDDFPTTVEQAMDPKPATPKS
jgi:Peptidase family M23